MRPVSIEESLKIIEPLVKKEAFIKMNSHKPWPHKDMGENVYRFTINIMSLDLLIRIMEHEQVENVFFTAAAAAPGQGMDGVSMNYKVYVKYHPVD
jgi:hypothetical protein